MRFAEAPLAGVWTIGLDPVEDERGMFARTYCEDEFKRRGLHTEWPQANISFNRMRGTIRGMHYQRPPWQEPKIVRCVRGRIFDVALDLREHSPSYGHWFGVELSAERRVAVYLPGGIAHGFQTLEDGCELLYSMGSRHHPEAARGIRWNDPRFSIEWPLPPTSISAKDAGYPDFSPD